MLGLEFFVRDATGLDGDQTLITVDAAGITEGVEDEAPANQFQIRLPAPLRAASSATWERLGTVVFNYYKRDRVNVYGKPEH